MPCRNVVSEWFCQKMSLGNMEMLVFSAGVDRRTQGMKILLRYIVSHLLLIH
jgi:hypothetical protein